VSSAKKNYLVLPRSLLACNFPPNSFDTPILFDVSFLLQPPLITSLRHFYSKRKRCLPGSLETQFSISFTTLEIFFKDMISIFKSIFGISAFFSLSLYNLFFYVYSTVIIVIFQVCCNI